MDGCLRCASRERRGIEGKCALCRDHWDTVAVLEQLPWNRVPRLWDWREALPEREREMERAATRAYNRAYERRLMEGK